MNANNDNIGISLEESLIASIASPDSRWAFGDAYIIQSNFTEMEEV